ncbi:MAG TPA: Uma2 family endonuclease [Blastocatellia bacterium]
MASAITTVQPSAILMNGISWGTYEKLLWDLRDTSTPRLFYDGGTLEVMSPSREHEESNHTLALLVSTVAEELGIDILNLGSTTYSRQDLQRGFEPDSSFYIKNLDRVAGKTTLDLASDPPPDLIIEVDISSSSIAKQPTYAAIGVPEVWVLSKGKLVILILDQHTRTYHESDRSSALPILSSQAINELIELSKSLRSTAWLKKVRAWVREAASRADEP